MKHSLTREQIDSLCAQDMCAYARALLLLDGRDIFGGWDSDCGNPEAYASARGIATAIITKLENGQGRVTWGDQYRLPSYPSPGYAEKLDTATQHILTTSTFPAWLYPTNTVNEPVKYDTWDDVLDELCRRGLTGSISLQAPGALQGPQCVLDVDGRAFYPTLETFGDAPYTIDEEVLAEYLDPFADIRKMEYVVSASGTELVTKFPGFPECRATYEGVVQVTKGWGETELKALNAWLAIVTKK